MTLSSTNKNWVHNRRKQMSVSGRNNAGGTISGAFDSLSVHKGVITLKPNFKQRPMTSKASSQKNGRNGLNNLSSLKAEAKKM